MTFKFYNNKDSVDQYIKMAKHVDGKHLIDKLNPLLQPGSGILELGSGPGTDWQILSNNFEVTGSDYSPEFLKRLKTKFPAGSFLLLDAVSLQTEKQFDAIYSNKVLHHLNDEELKKSIERQAHVLYDEGLVCHSFWKGEGTENYNGMFVNNHTEKELNSLFENHFEVLLLESYAEFEENDSLVLIARKR